MYLVINGAEYSRSLGGPPPFKESPTLEPPSPYCIFSLTHFFFNDEPKNGTQKSWIVLTQNFSLWGFAAKINPKIHPVTDCLKRAQIFFVNPPLKAF